MNLDETQKQQVADWLNNGASLAEIQERLEAEFGVNATYMEVKFLVSDLDLTPKDPEPDPADQPEPEAKAEPASPDDQSAEDFPDDAGDMDDLEPEAESAGMGQVSVEVDQLARPGAMISGKVTFANGKKCEWMLDQMGRLGVVPSEDGYKPTQMDLQQFQMALQDELKKMGL